MSILNNHASTGHSCHYESGWAAKQPVIPEQSDETVLRFEADLHHFLRHLSYYIFVRSCWSGVLQFECTLLV